MKMESSVKKARDIAWGLDGWSDDERTMIAAILPSPATIWKTALAVAERWEQADELERHTHASVCECDLCLEWWEERTWWTPPTDEEQNEQ